MNKLQRKYSSKSRKLLKKTEQGDSAIIYYSGHGSQVVDFDGDEEDGFDEIIWPTDMRLVRSINR